MNQHASGFQMADTWLCIGIPKPPLMLVGPAMSGKTTWAYEAAKKLNVETFRFGMADFSSSRAPLLRICHLAHTVGSVILMSTYRNPLILLDDMEIMSGDDILLEQDIITLLEGQAHVQVPGSREAKHVDTSRVTWVLATRGYSHLSPALTRRVHLCEV